ncbi:pilS cassette [Neisseria meningitidis]|nr:pilS cassette [Neisseria meningitidis]
MLSFRNLSEKTETAPPSFPQKRESRSVGTETYRENGFFRFYVLDSRFCGNDGLGIFIESRRWCFYANGR